MSSENQSENNPPALTGGATPQPRVLVKLERGETPVPKVAPVKPRTSGTTQSRRSLRRLRQRSSKGPDGNMNAVTRRLPPIGTRPRPETVALPVPAA
jgi:hypothetical protein